MRTERDIMGLLIDCLALFRRYSRTVSEGPGYFYPNCDEAISGYY
ncbi:hypothetical protein [Paenibacillus oryzae]|nr:hypothetical protein [Paenibacillus oryzae]